MRLQGFEGAWSIAHLIEAILQTKDVIVKMGSEPSDPTQSALV